MKKGMTFVFTLLLCLALGTSALAQGDSAKMLGTWEVDMGEEGQYTMVMQNNGIASFSINGVAMGEFGYMLRGNYMLSGMLDENGDFMGEVAEVTFVDENTATAQEDGVELTFKRTQVSEITEIVYDNIFVGTWIADLPEGDGFVMNFLAEGIMLFDFEGVTYDASYVVFENYMVMLDDQGETEVFSFEVVDENTMMVTELSTGEVAQFDRVLDAENAA